MPKPFENRVDPWGRLHRDPSRSATRMGNRGVLHDAHQEIVRQSASRAWLCCSLSLPGVHRTVFQVAPRFSYSELFFLDEATALSAGHRPCSDCQPLRFQSFKRAWCAAHHPGRDPRTLKIGEVDAVLAVERAGPRDGAALETLPVGTLFAHDGQAHLTTSGGHFRWSFQGYLAVDLKGVQQVEVLTPRATVAALRAGYVPALHPSVQT